MSLPTAYSMLTGPWGQSCERPSSRVSYSKASGERSGRWAGASTPRVGPSPSCASSLQRLAPPLGKPGGSSSKPSPRAATSGLPGAKSGSPDVPGPPPRWPSRWELPRPPRPWPSRTRGRRRNALTGPTSSPRRWRPPNTVRSGTPRYFRSTACRPRRDGKNNPRGVDARRCTPSTPKWAAVGALWRRVPRFCRVSAPCTRTPTGRPCSRAAGRPRLAVGAAPARPH